MGGEKAWTENKTWTEDKRWWAFGLKLKINFYERGWRAGVDSKKEWTPTKRGLEQSVDSNKAWTQTKRGFEPPSA